MSTRMEPSAPDGPGSVYEALVRRPVATVMACTAAVVFGLVSYTRLPLNLMPELDYPTITVRTEFPGAAPAEVETYVSEEVEEVLSTVPGLASLRSISRAGLSDVILEFDWDVGMGEVSQAVRERLAVLELLDEARRPLVLRYDPNLEPILRLALAAEDDTVEALMRARRVAEDEVRPSLERLPGVAAVKVRGGLEQEVTVELREGLLQARGFTVQAVVNRLADENLNLAGGSLLEGQTEYLIRTLNEFHGPDEIEDLVLVNERGGVARLGDLATVTVRAKEREVVGRVGGREAVEVSIYREADANIVAVSQEVRDRVFGTQEQRDWVEAEEARRAQAAEAGGADVGKPSKAKRGGKRKRGGKAKRGGKGKGKRGGKARRGGRGGPERERARMTAYLEHGLPEGMSFSLVSDQARFIEASITDVRRVALLGALLAVFVLFVFLRHGWSTFIIGLAIPVSVVATFAPMYLFGVSLNLMSLGGLALVIGMLVDNSIVVLESIHRCREEGDAPGQAAVRGTREVASAVAASTLTTVAVFFPIVFVTGVAGQLFSHLALTVVYGLLASLAVALFLIPVLAALPERTRLGTQPESARDPWTVLRFAQPFTELWAGLRWAWRTPLRGSVLTLPLLPLLLLRAFLTALVVWPAWLGLRVGAGVLWVLRQLARAVGGLLAPPGRLLASTFDRAFGVVEQVYERSLRAVLQRPSWVLFPSVLLFGLSLVGVRGLGTELLPELHQGVLTAEVRLPVGSPLERTLEVSQRLEQELSALPGVVSVYTAAGSERDAASAGDSGENTADLLLRLAGSDRPVEQERRIRDEAHSLAKQLAGLDLTLSSPALFSFRTPLEIEVRGESLEELRAAADTAVERLAGVPGLRDVRSNLQAGYPEVQIRYKRDKLAQYGLDIAVAARAVRDKVAGNVATDLRGQGRRTDVRVVLREADRGSLDDLGRLNVNPRGMPPIPLRAVADLEIAEGPSEIRRSEGERAALVTANLRDFDLGTMAERVDQELAAMPVEGDVRFEVGGQSREMEASLRSLGFALLLAVFLVYVIMASQFESILQPLVILFALPLAFVGTAAALWLGGVSVSVVVLIGGIVLAGIVVNNAIVLVDYANQLQARGLERLDAVVRAGRVRLRPILISSLTTVLGLLPMVLGTGEGSELRQPLALTIIAGLLSATVLTLGVIPVLYCRVGRRRGGQA